MSEKLREVLKEIDYETRELVKYAIALNDKQLFSRVREAIEHGEVVDPGEREIIVQEIHAAVKEHGRNRSLIWDTQGKLINLIRHDVIAAIKEG